MTAHPTPDAGRLRAVAYLRQHLAESDATPLSGDRLAEFVPSSPASEPFLDHLVHRARVHGRAAPRLDALGGQCAGDPPHTDSSSLHGASSFCERPFTQVGNQRAAIRVELPAKRHCAHALSAGLFLSQRGLDALTVGGTVHVCKVRCNAQKQCACCSREIQGLPADIEDMERQTSCVPRPRYVIAFLTVFSNTITAGLLLATSQSKLRAF
jgi:hypothetical protein